MRDLGLKGKQMRSLLMTLVLMSTAWAQTAPAPADTYQGRLLRLAEILGGLHSVRTLCQAGDSHWRDRMMEMLRLEKPSTDERNEMIERFNQGYATANGRFSSCTGEARAYSATLAREGEELSRGLAQSVDRATQQ